MFCKGTKYKLFADSIITLVPQQQHFFYICIVKQPYPSKIKEVSAWYSQYEKSPYHAVKKHHIIDNLINSGQKKYSAFVWFCCLLILHTN